MFELALPDNAGSENRVAIVADLATAVLVYVGYGPDAVAELAAAMRGAVASATTNGQQCTVDFHAHDGQLRIAIAYDGVAAWRTARPLP